jgi:acetyl esterase/lipase
VRRRGGLALLLWASLLAGACDAPGPTPSPSIVPSSTPSASSPTPTATPSVGPPSSPPPTIAPTPTPTVTTTPDGELLVVRTLPYATTGECGVRITECMQFVDVFAPAAGGPYPVAVMIHGRPRKPKDMEPLAQVVAAQGAVVFNVDYRGVRPVVQQGWPEAPEDVACAMRFARATAAQYGGDPSTLVLVGHSYGGYLGPLIALGGDEFDGQCLYGADEMSALPTGFVGIAGNYIVEGESIWETWYGGTPSERPNAWAKGDFRSHLGGNPTLAVRLIHERGDPIIPPRQARQFDRALTDAGYDSRLRLIAGDQHFGLLDPDGSGALVVPLILELLGLTP